MGNSSGLTLAVATHAHSFLSSYGPSILVYLLDGLVSAVLTWALYYRFHLRVDTTGQKLLALVCWLAIWFTSSSITALGYF